jgi:uncharacterized protein (DUF362 family)
MPCYFKNSRMTGLFDELGVVVTNENRDAIDQVLHDILSVDYRNCPATWKLIRMKLKEDPAGFKERLRGYLSEYIE